MFVYVYTLGQVKLGLHCSNDNYRYIPTVPSSVLGNRKFTYHKSMPPEVLCIQITCLIITIISYEKFNLGIQVGKINFGYLLFIQDVLNSQKAHYTPLSDFLIIDSKLVRKCLEVSRYVGRKNGYMKYIFQLQNISQKSGYSNFRLFNSMYEQVSQLL